MQRLTVAMFLVVGFGVGIAAAQPNQDDGAKRLAHRLNQLAQGLMTQDFGVELDRVEAALMLLDKASKLDASNVEIQRLKIEAMELSSHRADLNQALGTYLRLVPTDDVAQLKLIGLIIEDADTVEARLEIYERLLNGRGASGLTVALRSRVAFQAALYYREIGDLEKYGQYLKQAVTLDASHAEAAFEAYLFLEGRGVSQLERAKALLNVIAAAPAQADLHVRLARLLMECGQYDAAANWFDSASGLWGMQGYPDEGSLERIVNQWALSVWGAGQPSAALDLIAAFGGAGGDEVQSVLAVDLQLTQLAILTAVGRTDDAAAVFETLLLSLHPADEAQAVSVESMAMHAWAYLLFDRDVERGTQWVQLVRARSAEEDAMRARLEGWLSLRQGDHADAIAALETVAGDDVAALFGLGLVEGEKADEAGGKSERWLEVNRLDRFGLLGVWAVDHLQKNGERLVLSETERAVGRLVGQVPSAIRDIAKGSNDLVMFRVRNAVRAVGFAEPIEVEYELTNVSSIPLSLGPGQAIPTRVFGLPSLHHAGKLVEDVQPVVLDLHRRLRLGPGKSLAVKMAVDGGQLGEVLAGRADTDLLVRMINVYHPRVDVEGRYVPNLLGTQKPIGAVVRQAGELQVESVSEMIGVASGSDIGRRFSALAWLASVVSELGEVDAALESRVVGVLTDACAGGDAVLQAWLLSYLPVSAEPGSPFEAIVTQAVASKDLGVQMTLLVRHVESEDSPVLLSALRSGSGANLAFAEKIRDIIEKKLK